MHILCAGRFQPFHNGHYELLKAALACGPGEVVVGVIINSLAQERAKELRVTDMMRLGDSRQSAAANPLSVLERVRMISKLVSSEGLDERVSVVPLPRPEIYWELIQAILPGQRTWVLPRNDDPFEKNKQNFFMERGDLVVLTEFGEHMSGTEIRKLWVAGHEDLKIHVPSVIYQQLKNRKISE